MRYLQIRKLHSPEAVQAHLEGLGIEMPFDAEVDPGGPLSEPVDIHDSSAGTLSSQNRFAVLPMEGWDGTEDGRPTELVRRRWERFGRSGCGLVWGEATAVRPDGRANPHQLMLDERTVEEISRLRGLLDPGQVAGLQLTHSGRFSRPDGELRPRTIYSHPYLDPRVGATDADVLDDDSLDDLVGAYVRAACLADQAGFDFVDIKHCHGYLLHELLSARSRGGHYGGSLHNRTLFLRKVVQGIRSEVPSLAVAVRVSIFDMSPFSVGDGGLGAPEAQGVYRYAFGGDGTPTGTDLDEPDRFLKILGELGVGLVCTSAGSPYYNPHIQRPALFPPSDGYGLPEDPLVGVARQIAATAELQRRNPSLVLIGSGYSYLQEWLPNVAQAALAQGGVSMIGLGRMVLSYPDLAADILAGRPMDKRLICRTFSDCTTAPRSGLVSGCYPLDDYYKALPERTELAAVKGRVRRSS